jgi:hypothetical protein
VLVIYGSSSKLGDFVEGPKFVPALDQAQKGHRYIKRLGKPFLAYSALLSLLKLSMLSSRAILTRLMLNAMRKACFALVFHPASSVSTETTTSSPRVNLKSIDRRSPSR